MLCGLLKVSAVAPLVLPAGRSAHWSRMGGLLLPGSRLRAISEGSPALSQPPALTQGLPKRDVQAQAFRLLDSVKLGPVAGQRSGSYSGEQPGSPKQPAGRQGGARPPRAGRL